MQHSEKRLTQQLAFIHEIDKLKHIIRNTSLFDGSRKENDAEHSWHLALMAIVLSEHANEKFDLLKVIKMVLIHDIVEIDAGDTFLYAQNNSHQNTANEKIAAQRIFGLLPDDQAAHFIEIWEEFENRQTPEAKFARTIDRYEPILQNIANKGELWKQHQVSHEMVLSKNSIIEDGSITLWTKVKAAFSDFVNKGILK